MIEKRITIIFKKPIILAFIIILLALPLILSILGKPFYVDAIFLSIMYGIAALAWNLMEGYTGMFSLGHAVFFGTGAYTVMITMLYYKVSPWIGIWLGGFMAALVGLLLGFPLLRLRSHWFTLATIAVGEIFELAFAHWKYAGAARGLQAPIVGPQKALYYMQFTGPLVYTYIAFVILLIEIIILYKIVNSRIGYYFLSIREDELVAKTLGIDTFYYRMLSLIISGFFTGIAGGLYAARFRYVDPFAVFDLITISTYIAIAGVIGGIYSFIGPLVGAFIFVPIAEYIRVTIVSAFPRIYGLHVVIVGIILLLFSLFLPEGLMGYLRKKGYLKEVT